MFVVKDGSSEAKKEPSRQRLVRMRLVRKRGSWKQSRCGAEEEDAMPGYII